MAFTPNQQQAIDFDGHLLIVAGPGSGKTTTSIAKALRILSDPQRSLVMVTFTKEGAEEMKRRLEAERVKRGLAVFDESRLIVATFHSIAIRHLQKHEGRLKVMTPAQQSLLLRDALSMYTSDAQEERDVSKEFEYYMYSMDRTEVKLSDAAAQVIAQYRKRVEAAGQTDLFTVMRDCALKVSDGRMPTLPYTDMLVDEGQDTDDLQKVWIFAHAKAGCRVTIVGDDDQSIYEWRHALGYSGMKAFLDQFKAKRIELGDNFRSHSEILNRAVQLVECNKSRLGKHLVARRGKGGAIAAYRTPGQKDQAEELTSVIKAAPDAHKNAVVLARQNRSLDLLEMHLRSQDIEYKRVGKSIWENPNIANYLAWLSSLIDGTPIGLLGPLRLIGLSDQTVNDLLDSLKTSAVSFLDGSVPDLDSVSPEEKKSLQKFANDCKYWRQQLRSDSVTGGSVREVILETGAVFAEWVSKHRKGKAGELVEICSNILADMRGTMSKRLQDVMRKKSDEERAILLMTMHGSKGLEFETVHVIDASANENEGTLAQIEAARRLMYVALTRAKNRCIVWFSGQIHPSITEAQVPLVHTMASLKALF